MKIIEGKTNFNIEGECAIAIGKFDGIHRGHKVLLDKILGCKEQGFLATVFTFDPPPNEFFGQTTSKELTTREEKRQLFEEMGIDILVEYPLNETTAATKPLDFIEDILVGRMHAKFIAAGDDLSFGYKGAGNCKLLKELQVMYGYEVNIIPKVCEEDKIISSTYVRNEVEAGDMELVTKLLGREYMITGPVLHGRKLGRTIGMPTVNLIPPSNKLLPPNGVYYSMVHVAGEWYQGVTNVGCKPTVSNEKIVGVETYIYDFEQEVYGEEISVKLLKFERPEMHFDGVEELKAQMNKDMEAGKQFEQSRKI